MFDSLLLIYPWIKALHIMSVLAWMAGLFYLPRLFVYHAEEIIAGSDGDILFQKMEKKLLKLIMKPAMFSTWFFGILLALTPGIIDWSNIWPWTKTISVLGMTGMHYWLSVKRTDFELGKNMLSGRTYRLANEIPTLFMIVIVISVVVKF